MLYERGKKVDDERKLFSYKMVSEVLFEKATAEQRSDAHSLWAYDWVRKMDVHTAKPEEVAV